MLKKVLIMKKVKKEKYEKPKISYQKIFETSTLACGKCSPGPIIQPACGGFPKAS
jgi:hypothetical protein